ncbi:MAG: hypothetical protein KC609_05075, partial [Myxococcales bacterium]|nr:hypothetical protein [Myxococcales bacterium]
PLVKTRASIVSPFADVTGTVRVDETEHDFDGANAILMHIWGTERARKLIWCYVPAFDEPHVHWGLDFVSVKADRLAPWLTTAVLRRGDELIADHRPLTMLRGRSEIAYPRFTASCGLNGQRLHIEARADRDQGASYLYPDPGGTARFVVQSDVGSVTCRLQRPGEPELLLRSSTAAVEFHGVEPWDAQQPLAPPPL